MGPEELAKELAKYISSETTPERNKITSITRRKADGALIVEYKS